MLALLWNLSAAVRGYLRFYMPTNRALDWLRTPRGLKWAIPVALVAVTGYVGAVSVCAQLAAHPGLGWLNALVLLFFWNACKFAWIAVVGAIFTLRRVLVRLAWRAAIRGVGTRSVGWPC